VNISVRNLCLVISTKQLNFFNIYIFLYFCWPPTEPLAGAWRSRNLSVLGTAVETIGLTSVVCCCLFSVWPLGGRSNCWRLFGTWTRISVRRGGFKTRRIRWTVGSSSCWTRGRYVVRRTPTCYRFSRLPVTRQPRKVWCTLFCHLIVSFVMLLCVLYYYHRLMVTGTSWRSERLSRALKTVGPIDCDLTGPGCRFALKMIKYKRCSDVIVVTRRHVGGIVIVNKDRVKMLEIWKFLYRDYS